ncbi:MAG: hypothetical protein AAF889_12050 [Cyanobacteria bacterium P01_D01_bin.73]
MSQTDLLVLARQGNVEAIATLMNRKLSSVQVAVEAQLENDCLLLQLIAHGKLPSKTTLVTFVQRGMDILKARQVNSVQVSAWQAGATEPLWVEWLELGSDGYVPSDGSRQARYGAATTAETPQGQAFGVNIAALAATASGNGASRSGVAEVNSPQLPNLSGESPLEGLTSPPWDADPEGYYRGWMLQTGRLGWLYRWQIPRLAAFLVYFLDPQETLLDMVGVMYEGKQCVLLLTDQRLCCLGTSWLQKTVREFFNVPLAALNGGEGGGNESGVAIAPRGLKIHHSPQSLNALVRWNQVKQGRQFLQRSLQRVVSFERGDRLSNEAGNRSSGGAGSSSELTVWNGAIPGDRLSLWFYGLLCIITLVVLVLLFIAAP